MLCLQEPGNAGISGVQARLRLDDSREALRRAMRRVRTLRPRERVALTLRRHRARRFPAFHPSADSLSTATTATSARRNERDRSCESRDVALPLSLRSTDSRAQFRAIRDVRSVFYLMLD